MRFECNRSELLEALSNVSRAASPKSALAVIEGIFMRVQNNEVYLCCYNLDMGVAKQIRADIKRGGAAVMPIRLLDMVRKMPGERITIDCNEKYVVHIESSLTEFDIIAMPPDDFPELPIVESENSVSLPEGKLRSMISMTSHAISNRLDKPVYTGALFVIKDNKMDIVTLDGYRVAIRSEEVEAEDNFKFIVPGKTLTDVGRMLADTEDIVEISVSTHNIVFMINGYSIVSRLMSGEFTNYENAFNMVGDRYVKAKTSNVTAGVERMALVISDSHKNPVRCVFGGNRMKFSCETAVGRADSVMDCEFDNDDIVIGFNNRFLVDAFKAVDTDMVRIKIENNRLPMVILPPEGEHFRFLLMPLMLNETEKEEHIIENNRPSAYSEEDDEADFHCDDDYAD